MCFTINIGLWLLFVTKSSADEWCFAIMASTLATFGACSFACCADIRFSPTHSMILEAWRLPWYVLTGSWEILKALFKQLRTAQGADSYLAAVTYASCDNTSRAAARRTLEVTYTTATPNFVILGIVREQHLLLYHQVLKGNIRQMTRNLGATGARKAEGST